MKEKEVWQMTLKEYLELNEGYTYIDLYNYKYDVVSAIASYKPVTEKVAKSAGTILGDNVYEMWLDYHNSILIALKYGKKHPSMSIEEFADILKSQFVDQESISNSIMVEEVFNNDDYITFLKCFTPEQFYTLVNNTDCTGYTPYNYCISAYPGLTFTGVDSELCGIYVSVGDSTELPEGTRLVEDVESDSNFLFFTDVKKGILYYYDLRTKES